MAVFGIGASFGKTNDVSSEFIKHECACIGYSKSEASSLYEMLGRIKKGDIIYIKSYQINGNAVIIKAIGYVLGSDIEPFEFTNIDKVVYGRKVIWKKTYETNKEWIKISLPKEDIKNNVYNNTLYEEYSDTIINDILEKL